MAALFPRKKAERDLEVAKREQELAIIEAETERIRAGEDDDDSAPRSSVATLVDGGVRLQLGNGATEDVVRVRDFNVLKKAIADDDAQEAAQRKKGMKQARKIGGALNKALKELRAELASIRKWQDEAEAAAGPATDEMFAMSTDLTRIGDALITFVDSSVGTVNRLDKANDWMLWASNAVRAFADGFTSGPVRTLFKALAAVLNALAFYDVQAGIMSIFTANLDAYAPRIAAGAPGSPLRPIPVT